jgi:hypothetical protein
VCDVGTRDSDVVAEDDAAHAGGDAGEDDEGCDPAAVVAPLLAFGDDADCHD